MRLQDLAVLVLHDRRVRAVQHPGKPAGGQRRAVAPALEALPGRLDPDELDLGIVHERREHPDRVRSASDAGDDPLGQAPGLLQHLRPRLVADHPLQIPDERRIRRRSDARPDDVVRGLDVRDPVADRRRHGLLQRPSAGLDGFDRGAEQRHPLHVRPLAAHVHRAHVDDALEVEQRACGRRGHAVHPRARLGDDSRLAHPPGQQRLTDRVVDLVRAGVVEVLAL